MDIFTLDIRTLNFIVILFSVIYCIGLLLFQVAQKPIKGLSLFSLSIFIIGTGPLLLSLRGVIPDYLSIIGANLFIAAGFHLTLYSLSLFRGYSVKLTKFSSLMLLVVFVGFVFFTYFEPSIKNRVVVISLYMAFVTISTAVVVIKGRNEDLPLATRMMALSFMAYGLFMLLRVVLSLSGAEIKNFMAANLIHQLTFLFSIILIVSMSFSMIWMINARLLRSIHCLSYQDPLTELQNRRALDDAIPLFQQQAQSAPVCMILSDIDNFKSINDQCGHLVGDDVIKVVAKVTLQSLYDSAVAFRLGGDEILILLPNCNLEQAKQFTDELRQSIVKLTIDEQPSLHVTSSFGIAQLSPTENWKACVERADKALYRVKHNGRNTLAIER
ncbi:GGDEF domain-containing protein [Motilimonas cestriensis]|uniref:diguanylate cyclase n=1 Tax=Motilimonas cestriensis TaxID=2742685 RepID=A0ABS8WA34_9GAMM|nr:GGDEF domain-containing protein [Motilimonas cestriensis]MCE2595345.1 GGDEF domain-containing protein [Motilimonas cestriensis]